MPIAIASGLVGPLAAGSAAMVVALTALVSAKKLQRNARERRSSLRRAAYRQGIASSDLGSLAAATRGSARRFGPRSDLLSVLRAAQPGEHARTSILEAARESGLVERLVRDCSSRNPVGRGVAGELLGRLGCDEAVEQLERLLRDADPEVRGAAARGLGALATPEAAWCLVGALDAALLPADRVLEQLGRPFAVHVLLDAFHVSELAPIRGDIADALGLARAVSSLHAIASLIRFGSERERIKACRALGRLARLEAVPLLLEALEDEAWVIRAQAAAALGRIGDTRAVRPLEQALGDAAWWVRANAAEALRACGEPGREALRRAVAATDRFARDRAREALALDAALATSRCVLPLREAA
jgi:HEAT repeat protein